MNGQYKIKTTGNGLMTTIVDRETGVSKFLQCDESIEFHRQIESCEDPDIVACEYFNDINETEYLDGLFRIIGLVPNDPDGAEAIYWFLADHHNGQSSIEYRMLSLLSDQFSPSRMSRGIDSCDEMTREYYSELCAHFGYSIPTESECADCQRSYGPQWRSFCRCQ